MEQEQMKDKFIVGKLYRLIDASGSPTESLQDVLPDVYGRKEHKALMEAHREREAPFPLKWAVDCVKAEMCGLGKGDVIPDLSDEPPLGEPKRNQKIKGETNEYIY